MPYKDPEKQRTAQNASCKRRRAVINATVTAQRRALRVYIDSKKTSPCKECGQAYPPRVMDFHHVRGEKKHNLSVMANRRFPIPIIDEEIAKCDLLCANCHRLQHPA